MAFPCSSSQYRTYNSIRVYILFGGLTVYAGRLNNCYRTYNSIRIYVILFFGGGIQAVPFALFIDLLRLQTRFVHFVLFGGLTVYAGGYNVFTKPISM